MPTETTFLLAAMDLLDDGRCPTGLLGNSAWGRLIATGRELLAAGQTEGATPPAWSRRVPTAPGHYWFYGKPHESDAKPLTSLVRVIDSGQLRPIYQCDGQILYPFDAYGLCRMFGLWREADVPEPPAGGVRPVADTVYFGDNAYCRAHPHDGYRRDSTLRLGGLEVTGNADSVFINPVTRPARPSDLLCLALFPAEYADLLALALLRQQVPHLLRREGLNPDTPWQVLADYLRDQNTDTSVREATLLQLAFAELESPSEDIR